MVFSGCKDDPIPPTVVTKPVSEIMEGVATLNAEITNPGSDAITSCGFYYNTSSDMSYPEVVNANLDGSHFSAVISNLEPGKTYYYMAFAKSNAGLAEGETLSFATQAVKPIVETRSVSEVTTSGATLNAAIPSNGGSEITACGFYYSTSASMSNKQTAEFSGIPDSLFSVAVSGLQSFTTYYYKAFATNALGTAEGEVMQFTTVIKPSVTTNAATDLHSASATLNGNVTNHGGTTSTVRGFVYGTSAENLADSVTSGTGSGAYSKEIAGLTPSTTYYFKAFASNSAGTVYGEVKQFATKAAVTPTVQTNAATSITATTATFNGNVTAAGNDPVTVRGFMWGTSSSNLSNNVESGSGTGSFTKEITGLTHSTTYYYKAYATNAAGTSYGQEKSFATTTITAPTVQTNAASSISMTGATLNGNITADGGATVTARGFVYGTSASNLSQNVQSGSGTGSFTKVITGLSHSTTYYYKAYATNAIGTNYGEVKTFTTTAITAPIVQTSGSQEYVSAALLYGYITSDGGATVTASGFMYGTNSLLLIQNVQANNESGLLGSFYAEIRGLPENTTYYYKAYATNSEGTSYGEVLSFTTKGCSPGLPFTDSRDGNVYSTVIIGDQTWMAENLRYEGNTSLGSTASPTTKYRYYPNGNSSNVATYGYLYNWPAVMNGASSSNTNPSGVQGICPNGWHLPSKAEWDHLRYELDYNDNTGAQLAGNLNLWESGVLTSSSMFGTSGFNALPAGCYSSGYGYSGFGQRTIFWTSTVYSGDSNYAWDEGIFFNQTYLGLWGNPDYEYSFSIDNGASVRCVRDSQNKGTIRSKNNRSFAIPVKTVAQPCVKSDF